MTSKIKSEIRIEPRKAEDGSTYWTASAVGVSGVVGGGDTPEEALIELQENYDVLFSRDKLLSRDSVLSIIGKNRKRMDTQCYYDMLDDVFNMLDRIRDTRILCHRLVSKIDLAILINGNVLEQRVAADRVIDIRWRRWWPVVLQTIRNQFRNQ